MTRLLDAMLYCYRQFWLAEINSGEEDYYWCGFTLLRDKVMICLLSIQRDAIPILP